jgi:hypothetical protein
MKGNVDPPKTQSLAPRSTTDGLTKKQRERQQRLEKIQAQQQQQLSNIPISTFESQKIDVSEIFTEEKRAVRFAKGMGIRKIELNRVQNSIEFELEPEFEGVLQTICSWKGIDPHKYLSQLLMEYFLQVKERQKLN